MEEVEGTLKLPSFGTEFLPFGLKHSTPLPSNGYPRYDNSIDWKYLHQQFPNQGYLGEQQLNRYVDYGAPTATNAFEFISPPRNPVTDKLRQKVLGRQNGQCSSPTYHHSTLGETASTNAAASLGVINSFPNQVQPPSPLPQGSINSNVAKGYYPGNGYPTTSVSIAPTSPSVRHFNSVSISNHLIASPYPSTPSTPSYYPPTSQQDQCYNVTNPFESQPRHLNTYTTPSGSRIPVPHVEENNYYPNYSSNFEDYKRFPHLAADYLNPDHSNVIRTHLPHPLELNHTSQSVQYCYPTYHPPNITNSLGQVQTHSAVIAPVASPLQSQPSIASYDNSGVKIPSKAPSMQWNPDLSTATSHSTVSHDSGLTLKKTSNVNACVNISPGTSAIRNSSLSSAFAETYPGNVITAAARSRHPKSAPSPESPLGNKLNPERTSKQFSGKSWVPSPAIVTHPTIRQVEINNGHDLRLTQNSSPLTNTTINSSSLQISRPSIISYNHSVWPHHQQLSSSSPSFNNQASPIQTNYNKIPSFELMFPKQSELKCLPKLIIKSQETPTPPPPPPLPPSPHQFRPQTPLCPTPLRMPPQSPSQLQSPSPGVTGSVASQRNISRSAAGKSPTMFFPSRCPTPSTADLANGYPQPHEGVSTTETSLLNDEQRRLERLRTNGKMEPPTCNCVCKEDTSQDRVQYYDHLGSGESIADIRSTMEKRWGVQGIAIRFEKLVYTGKEGKTSQGCPIAKWVIRRSGPDEKYLVLVKEREGHHCKTAWIVVVIVAWEGVSQPVADDLYETLVYKLTKFGMATQRRCGLNEQRTCACQGTDQQTCGASFSFGCSWSMYYNGCKYARSKCPRKFKLSQESEEAEVETKLQQLATDLSPLYKAMAPASYNNQTEFEHLGYECRLGNKPGKPWTGVTACVDFCAHAHKDLHNMNNGCTVVATLTKHRGYGKPDDEQLHVLPLYVLDGTDEYGNKSGQEEKVKNGSIEILTKYPMRLRLRNTPMESCRKRAKTLKEKKNQKGQSSDFIIRSSGGYYHSDQSAFQAGLTRRPYSKCRKALFQDGCLETSETKFSTVKPERLNGKVGDVKHEPFINETFDFSSFKQANYHQTNPKMINMMFPNLQAAQGDYEDIGMHPPLTNFDFERMHGTDSQIYKSSGQEKCSPNEICCSSIKQESSHIHHNDSYQNDVYRQPGQQNIKIESELLSENQSRWGVTSTHILPTNGRLQAPFPTMYNSNPSEEVDKVVVNSSSPNSQVITGNCNNLPDPSLPNVEVDKRPESKMSNSLESNQVTVAETPADASVSPPTSKQIDVNVKNENFDRSDVLLSSDMRNGINIKSEPKSPPSVRNFTTDKCATPTSISPSDVAFKPYVSDHLNGQDIPRQPFTYTSKVISNSISPKFNPLVESNPSDQTFNNSHFYKNGYSSVGSIYSTPPHSFPIPTSMASMHETPNGYPGKYIPNTYGAHEHPSHLAPPPMMNTGPSLTKDSNLNPSFLFPLEEVPLVDFLSDVLNIPETHHGAVNGPVYPHSSAGCQSNSSDPEGFYEVYSENEDNFSDSTIGGVAIALAHGSVLFECAKNELHATTALKNPNRYEPKRISLVFYQHKNMNYRKHGMGEYEKKLELKKNEEALAEYNFKDETNNDEWQNESLSSLRKKRKLSVQQSHALKSPVTNHVVGDHHRGDQGASTSLPAQLPPFVPQTNFQNAIAMQSEIRESYPASGATPSGSWLPAGLPYPPLVVPAYR